MNVPQLCNSSSEQTWKSKYFIHQHQPAQEGGDAVLHQLPEQVAAQQPPGAEVSAEAAPLDAQGPPPHHPALQAPAGDQHGPGRQGEGDHHRAPRRH